MIALFEIVPANKLIANIDAGTINPKENFASVKINYKLPLDSVKKVTAFTVPLKYTSFNDLDTCLRFASSVAMFGSLLKESVYAKKMSWNETIILANNSYDKNDLVQKEFISIIEKAKKIYGKRRKKR